VLLISLLCLPAFCGRAYGDHPTRIVSLSPSITEEIHLLGVQDELVGCTVYCRVPQSEHVKRVGTVMGANLEGIVRLKPDLVLATTLMNQGMLDKLAGLGIGVKVFRQPRSFKEICDQFLELSKMMGMESKARGILKKVVSRVEEIRKESERLEKVRVFVEIGAKPLFTVTRDSFINDLVAFAGGENIAGDAAYGIYSREEVMRQDPDAIVIVTMGITAEERRAWQRFKCMKAVRSGRIYVIDSYKLCSPTPITFVKALEEMVRILHPGKISWKKS